MTLPAPGDGPTDGDPVPIVVGDILACTETYLCHQCNTVTRRPHGIADVIERRFPGSVVYGRRPLGKLSLPGTVDVGRASDGRFVINMIAQRYPGRGDRYKNDTYEQRACWFDDCLRAAGSLPRAKDGFAFPYLVGCHLAGGNWNAYYAMIKSFKNRTGFPVRIYDKFGIHAL